MVSSCIALDPKALPMESSAPHGIVISPGGSVYIGDHGNNRLGSKLFLIIF